MELEKKTETMDGLEFCKLNSKLANIVEHLFFQRITCNDAKSELEKIYQQHKDRISRNKFNEQVESVLESTLDCYQRLVDEFDDAKEGMKA